MLNESLFFTSFKLSLQVTMSLLVLASFWKVFTKAGREGWKALIPIYNLLILADIAKISRWHVLGLFIPLVNFYSIFKLCHGMSKSFGYDIGFTIGLIFLGVIFYPILAFGNSKYNNNGMNN